MIPPVQPKGFTPKVGQIYVGADSFEHEADVRRFWDAMRQRFEHCALELHEEKTRLLEFGRFAAARRQRRELGKQETFTFPGFIFICGKSRRGAFQLYRKTRGDRMRATLRDIKAQLRDRRHDAIPDQGRWLRSVVTGYFAYHAVLTNYRALGRSTTTSLICGGAACASAGQRDGMTWNQMSKIGGDWLPSPRILHPWPERRFAVKYPKWEPNA